MSDVWIFNTAEGGEIEFITGEVDAAEVGGDVTLNNGLESGFYLALFGGNEDDPATGEDLSKSWWGNALESDPTYHMRSRTQYLLRSIPATSGNLVRIQQAVEKDLEWALTLGVVDELRVSVSIPRLNWINIVVDTESTQIQYSEPWEGSLAA